MNRCDCYVICNIITSFVLAVSCTVLSFIIETDISSIFIIIAYIAGFYCIIICIIMLLRYFICNDTDDISLAEPTTRKTSITINSMSRSSTLYNNYN